MLLSFVYMIMFLYFPYLYFIICLIIFYLFVFVFGIILEYEWKKKVLLILNLKSSGWVDLTLCSRSAGTIMTIPAYFVCQKFTFCVNVKGHYPSVEFSKWIQSYDY